MHRCGLIVAVFFSCIAFAEEGKLPFWSYSDMESWPRKDCAFGTQQSPIAFEDAFITPRGAHTLQVEGNCALGPQARATMDLTHRQVAVVDPNWNCLVVHPLSKGSFKVFSIHLHTRAEHALRGKDPSTGTMEIHIVMNKTTDESQKMVLGIVLREAREPTGLPIERALSAFVDQATDDHDGAPFPGPLALRELFPNHGHSGGGLLYQGSLTTPNCSEVVSWFVFDTQSPVHSTIIQKLRKLQLNRTGEEFNNRPIQRSQGRNVSSIELVTPTLRVKKASSTENAVGSQVKPNHSWPPRHATSAPMRVIDEAESSPSLRVLSGNSLIILLIVASVLVAWWFVRGSREAAAGTGAPTAQARHANNYGSV